MSEVRAAVLNGYVPLLNRLGGKPGDALAQAGLPRDYFEAINEDSLVGIDTVNMLLNTAVEVTANPLFALRLGSQQDISILGLIGYLMRQSFQVGEALDEFCHYFKLHVRDASAIEVDVTSDCARLCYIPKNEGAENRNSVELAIAQGLVIMRALCGPRWKASGICFRHGPATSVDEYQGLLDTSVVFAQHYNCIEFDSQYLSQVIPEADPKLKAILEAQAVNTIPHKTSDLLQDLTELIHQMIPAGQCNVELAANYLCMHRRTLHRRLKKEGTSFAEVFDRVRESIAVERLRYSDWSVLRVADYLGYSDSSAFIRAFKRWTGCTPQDWRTQLK